jgi:DNA-binding NarL/FixJ family response regulator
MQSPTRAEANLPSRLDASGGECQPQPRRPAQPAMHSPHHAGSSALAILIVDDHAIVREGLKRVLEGTDSPWTVAESDSGHLALDMLRQGGYDVAVIDLSMPGMSGLELLRRARAEFPCLKLLVLSMHAEEQYAMRAFKSGANGYVTKDSASRELALAVRKVAAGGAYVSASLAERMVLHLNGSQAAASHTLLSDREIDVLRRLTAGQRPSEIAQALHLSVKTVSTHKTRILAKLNLPGTAALIRYGMEQGFAAEPSGTGH